MTKRPDRETLDLLAAPGTLAVIATADDDGTVQLSPSYGLGVDDEGRLVHRELLESSPTSRNLLRALWFGGRVALLLYGSDGRSRILRGRAQKVHISGPIFRRHYEDVLQSLGDAGLAGVWLIELEEAEDLTYPALREREKELFPFHRHLDQFVLQEALHA